MPIVLFSKQKRSEQNEKAKPHPVANEEAPLVAFGHPKPPRAEGAPVARPVPCTPSTASDTFTLTLTANAGVMLDYSGTRLLVDGLHDGAEGFSAVPSGMREAVCTGAAPFEGIGWLLYTHLHSDHFSAEATGAFLRTHPQAGVLAPERLPQSLQRQGHTLLTVRENPESGFFETEMGAVRVRAFFCPHAGEQYADVVHACYLMECGARNVLFVGDGDYRPDFFGEKLEGIRIDVAVVNPLFVSGSKGRETLTEGIMPGRIVVDHIPFEGEDPMRFREMTARCLARYGAQLPPAEVLWVPADMLTL